MAKVTKKTNEIEKLGIDKDAIIKEIKGEIKEQVLDELSKEIEYETRNKLDKMEKRIYKYKNFSILKRNVIILIFLTVIIFETKILYDNKLLYGQAREENDQIIENSNSDDDNQNTLDKDLNWYIDKYEYLLDNIKTSLNDDAYYLYKNDLTRDNIDNKVKLNMAYELLDKSTFIDNGVIRVNEDKLKNSYKKIFGEIDSYTPENFSSNCINFIYNDSLKSYIAINETCNKNEEEILRKITNITLEDNRLIFELSVGILNLENKNLTNINGDIIEENYSNDIDDIADRLNKYEFIFEHKNDEYYISEIKRIG